MATIQPSDVLPVRSRISWGAILAGAFIAVAVNVLLTALGAALGISARDRMDADSLGMAAGIWAAAGMLISLFLGGFVVSRCTVGESKLEAVMYGAVLWGVVFTMLALTAAGAIGAALNATTNLAGSPAAASVANQFSEKDWAGIGVPADKIDQNRTLVEKWNKRASEIANDPRTTAAAWWTVAGIVISMLAAITGALVGAGPNMIIAAVRVRAPAVATDLPERETTVAHR